MPNGQQLVVGAGDGGVVPADAYPPELKKKDSYGNSSQPGYEKPGYGVEGYGNAANVPPAYSTGGLGEPAGAKPQGYQYPR